MDVGTIIYIIFYSIYGIMYNKKKCAFLWFRCQMKSDLRTFNYVNFMKSRQRILVMCSSSLQVRILLEYEVMAFCRFNVIYPSPYACPYRGLGLGYFPTRIVEKFSSVSIPNLRI